MHIRFANIRKHSFPALPAHQNAPGVRAWCAGLLPLLLTTYYLLFTSSASAAVLSLSPSTGTFEIGGILETAIVLDSEGAYVNAIEASLLFPPDKLQLISPTTGNSIITLWTSQPTFNNSLGTVRLQGVVPGGVNASRGLVTTLRFRVRAPGNAFVKFTDATRVLLHDGKGTDVLKDTQNAVFILRLPPPLGPVVASPTHPDQTRWYPAKTALLQWNPIIPDMTGFSYSLSRDPVDIPDDISEGKEESVTYRNLADGTHYFHIKSLQGRSWGGTTHFALNVDTMPPAEFPLEVLPGKRTNSTKPVLQFITTDVHSGLDRYEVKIVPLSLSAPSDQPLFIEATSPFVIPPLTLGNYDAIVRAYDVAGNYRDVTERISIIKPFFRYFDERGVYVGGESFPWLLIFLLLLLLILPLFLLARRVKRFREEHEYARITRGLPMKVDAELSELQKYREKYGKLAASLILALTSLFLTALLPPTSARAEGMKESATLEPPVLDAFARDISNEDIFYAGGKLSVAHANIVLYLQNLRTGEVTTTAVTSDENGEWFYRHDAFLSPGDYILWTQTKVGSETSPPSPENRLTVRETAIEIGSSRFSYEFMYLVIIALLLLVISALIANIVIHAYHGRRHRMLWMKEVREAQEAVRRGFAVLRRDIEAELEVLKKVKLTGALSREEKKREEELLSDMKRVEDLIGKEVLDIERVLR